MKESPENPGRFIGSCDGCHRMDPTQGFFGSGGEPSFEGEPQNFKIAHMRSL